MRVSGWGAGLLAVLAWASLGAAETTRFLAVDNGANRLLLVDRVEPTNGWSVPLPRGCRDLQLVDGNRVLVSHGDGAGEYDLATGASKWKVDGFKGVNTARRCADGTTLLGMNVAGAVRFVWIAREGKEVRRLDVTGCRDLRLVRITKGGLLFTVSKPTRVVEVDAKGAVSWTGKLDGKGYLAIRKDDGTTLATTGGTCSVTVLDRDGKKVRHFGGHDAHPKARLQWFSGFDTTPDGGVLVANWCGHGKEKQGPHVVAFDAANRLAWVWEDHEAARSVTNVLALGATAAAPTAPVAVRVENLTVLPSTGPLANITVRNRSKKSVNGRLDVGFPAGWKTNKTSEAFALKPSETKRIPFAIEKGRDDPANQYPIKVQVQVGEMKYQADRTITATTAPYFKPVVDGKRDDWKDAVPVTFVSGGKKTTISTYWSRRKFSLLVAVEEDHLERMPPPGGKTVEPFDAIQFAMAPRDAVTPTGDDAQDQRAEFLIAGGGDGGACYTLYQPEQKLALARKSRPLAGLETTGAQVAVSREKGWTYYECSIPFKALPMIRPDPGREVCFSVLVHDPDGTGLRDWGQAAGLAPDQRNRLAWCMWQGSKWPKEPPFDQKIEWGFCSSKQ
jgi:hypothetical protein